MRPLRPRAARVGACAAAAAVLCAGCGLLPGGGDDASPPAPAAPLETPTATTQAPTTTQPSQVELVDLPVVPADVALGAEDLSAATTEAPTTTTEAPQAPTTTTEPGPAEAHYDDMDSCAEQFVRWTVARLRDGACAGWVQGTGWEIGGPPADDTFLGLVCHWTGEEEIDGETVQQGEVKVFAVLPTIAGDAKISFNLFRWWVFPLERYASAWRSWSLSPEAPPEVDHDDGLLLGPLADILAAEIPPQQPEDPFEQPSGIENGEQPASANAGADASEGVHPDRVAFAPSAVTRSFVGDQDREGDGDDPNGEVPVLRRYSDPEERRFGRPFEIWLEAQITLAAEEDEEAEPEIEFERWTFPLIEAADALRIVTDDCAALNERADPEAG